MSRIIAAIGAAALLLPSCGAYLAQEQANQQAYFDAIAQGGVVIQQSQGQPEPGPVYVNVEAPPVRVNIPPQHGTGMILSGQFGVPPTYYSY